MDDPDSLSSILWSSEASGQQVLWFVLGAALVAAITVYGPLSIRLLRLYLLDRRLRDQLGDAGERRPPGGATDPLREAMDDSPLAESFAEFDRRWTTAQLGEANDRAPIRLIDVFEDKPLLPFGPRRSLLPTLPGLFLGLGVFGALLGLIPSLSSLGADEAGAEAQSAWLALQLGQALRVTAWGFLFGLGASITGRLLEGAFNARAVALDELVESAYGSVSPGELAELTRQTQQKSLETLGKELNQFGTELNERLDRGLQRIEQSTSRAATLVSQEQRGALHTVVQELSLSVRQGVEHHLAELRNALQLATENQSSVTRGLADTFDRLVKNAQTQERVARTLTESANSVEEAARTMRGTAGEMQPVLDHLGTTSRALSDTADRIGDTQQVVARTAEGVRTSLEHAAEGVEDQRQFIERSLSEIRRALVGLGDGLGDSLQRSLREVDDVLGSTVGQLRDTLAESNETIERLAGPIRAAEGSTRETHVALDRVRNEVEALGQWMNQAVKPLRSGLTEVETRSEEISRAISEFTNHTRQIDKTMDALREEIHEESRRLQGAGSDLGRRLTQATDAVALLETATSEAARKARPRKTSPLEPEPGTTRDHDTSVSRNRSWAPAPSSEPALQTAPPRETSRFDRPPPGAAPPQTPPAAADFVAADASEDVNESTGRDLPLSGFRMGTPRAQGPDPYARFDEAEDGTDSNVLHSPTADRELGEELKLSELLGPSGQGREDGDDDKDESE